MNRHSWITKHKGDHWVVTKGECLVNGDPSHERVHRIARLELLRLSSQVQSLTLEVERLRKREALLELTVTLFQNGFDTMNGPKKHMGEVMEDIFRTPLNKANEVMRGKT